MPKLFGRFPKATFEIRRIEAFRERSMPSSYNAPSFDGTRPGVFYLNAIDLTDRGGPNNQIAMSFGVKVIPTLVIVGPDGSRSDFLTGSVPEQRLFEWIENRKMKKAK